MPKVRLAALQFAAGIDMEENLQTCLRMIEQAAEHRPQIIVMPEFCNHASWYRDQDHAYEVALELEGFFTQAIAAKAKESACYIMLNATVRREKPQVTGTNMLFNPNGEMIAISDKQVLMGNENNFLSKASEVCPIIETEFGYLGMYSCMDGVIYETPRGLAVRGAQILLNSLNSFADDEASLHVPVRAAENKVFIVAANKVGSLVPEELAAIIAEHVKISPEQLHGAGESQIIAPDGTVLAKAPRTGEAVIIADIDPSEASAKLRPDGTDIMKSRRPDLYAPIAKAPNGRVQVEASNEVQVAVYQSKNADLGELLELIPSLENIAFLVLPEAFIQAEQLSTIQSALKENACKTLIASSYLKENQHLGVLIGQDGIVLEQAQLHPSKTYEGIQLGENIKTYDSLFGRVALVVGNDSIYPELFRVLALQGVSIVLNPNQIQEAWEVQTGLIERAAENRINIIMASRPSDFATSLILTVDEDFTLWTEWKKRPFDGNINYPIVNRATEDGLFSATIYPAASANRMVSQKTDVVDGRPYWLLEALVES